MIGMNSYNNAAPMSGFGAGSDGQAGKLQKALEAGYQITTQTGGSSLRVESLEGSLKVVTYTANHIKLWRKIPKSAAYSTVEEYNELTSYGSTGLNRAFVPEGTLPTTEDSTYQRRTSLVKYVGVTREVTHQMSVVHPAHGDVIALENQNGILWLLQQIENALFKGDSSLAFDGESEQWDGLDSLIDPTSFVDLEGQPLQESTIEEAANLLVEQFAYPTDLLLGTRVASDLVKNFYPRERFTMPAPQNGMVGMTVNSVMTQAGNVELGPNVFLKRLPNPPAAATGGGLEPQVVIAPTFDDTGADGDFNKGVAAGDGEYNYAVTACNRFGESAPAFGAANHVLTQAEADLGEHIDVTITNGASVDTARPPEYYRVYRTRKLAGSAAVSTNVADYSLIAQIASADQGNDGVTDFDDLNFILPFTEIAYMGQMTEDVLTFRQLLPMLRMDLAVLSPAYRWMILLYGTPILFAPKKWLRLINIGRLTA